MLRVVRHVELHLTLLDRLGERYQPVSGHPIPHAAHLTQVTTASSGHLAHASRPVLK